MGKESVNHAHLANQALVAYGLADAKRIFIRHSDTFSYKVETAGGDIYLLRLHIPLNQAMGTHGADYAAVNSELLWLEALCQESDLVLQQPVRNLSGALVTEVQSPEDSETINCTLLHWLTGEPYHRDLETGDTAFQIGKIAATLHDHASRWEVPAGFVRPNRDIAYFKKVLQGIQPAVTDGRISAADYKELEISVGLLVKQLECTRKNRQTYGLMHADMHKGNMLLHQGQIRLIDFSFCAFGIFMFDLAVGMSDMKEELHRAFLEGYRSQRSFPSEYQRLVEGLFVGSMVGAFSYWVPNPDAAALLSRKVPQIAQEFAVKYNRGEHFWF